MENMMMHVETLGRHGATVKILNDNAWIPLTAAFYVEALETCRNSGYNAIAWDMKIPESNDEMMICIWKNGHVDSGNAKRICEIMSADIDT